MKLALDLDDTITRYPEFFSKLSQLWCDDVYILTFRSDMQSCIDDCKRHNIKYTEIILANKDDDSKAKEIERLGIEVFFDDCPEFLVHVPKNVATFMTRCENNFDYARKQFLLTKYTGRIQSNGNDDWFLGWCAHVMPDIRAPIRIFKIKEVFDAVNLEVTEDVVTAVQTACLKSESLQDAYHEYMQHAETFSKVIDRAYEQAIQTVVRNVIRDETPPDIQNTKEN